MVLTALKGHERDALQSLALSLAGRQLGDDRLSGLVASTWFMRDAFLAALKEIAPEVEQTTTLEELADISSSGLRTNYGNRFGLNEDGEIMNEHRAVYPDPKAGKVEKPDN